jgi:hypothetical protein
MMARRAFARIHTEDKLIRTTSRSTINSYPMTT